MFISNSDGPEMGEGNNSKILQLVIREVIRFGYRREREIYSLQRKTEAIIIR